MFFLKKIACLLFISFFVCCKSYYLSKYKLNRPFEFKTKKDYYNTVIKEMNFPDSLLLYSDSAGYNRFGNIIVNNGATLYVGSFVNDSVYIKKSDFLKDNESCIGRMETEIEEHISIKEFPPGSLDSSINMHNIDFYSFKENRIIPVFPENKKVKIILLYSYTLGTYYKKLYHEIIDVYEKNRNSTDLYIISFDPIAYLKDK